jgi:hypothetical protein
MLSDHCIRRIVLTMLIFPIGLTSACLKFPFFKDMDQNSPEMEDDRTNSSNVKITSLRIPKKGERIEILDPRSEKVFSVTVDEVFTAASGKICSNFTVNEKNIKLKKNGLACLNKNHEWDKNSLEFKFIQNE